MGFKSSGDGRFTISKFVGGGVLEVGKENDWKRSTKR